MDIDQARLLKIGDIVRCPRDRDDPSYEGTVAHVGTATYKNWQGHAYMWITVRRPSGTSAVWPSIRIS